MVEDTQLDTLLKQNQAYERQTEELNDKIEILIERNSESERKNANLTLQIEAMLSDQQKVEQRIKETKRNSSLADYTPTLGIYLKGMYDHYDFEHNALVVMIEGRTYYYPLQEYQCLYLPMAGSRILVFQSEANKRLVFGFDVAQMIEPAKKIKAEIKSMLITQQRIKVLTKEYGFLELHAHADFFETAGIKLGDQRILNQVYIDGNHYFSIDEETFKKSERDTILKTLLKERI